MKPFEHPPMIEVPDDTEAFWALFADELAKPLAPIPLHETPIYAGLKAEYEVQERINELFARNPLATTRPILNNGRKP